MGVLKRHNSFMNHTDRLRNGDAGELFAKLKKGKKEEEKAPAGFQYILTRAFF